MYTKSILCERPWNIFYEKLDWGLVWKRLIFSEMFTLKGYSQRKIRQKHSREKLNNITRENSEIIFQTPWLIIVFNFEMIIQYRLASPKAVKTTGSPRCQNYFVFFFVKNNCINIKKMGLIACELLSWNSFIRLLAFLVPRQLKIPPIPDDSPYTQSKKVLCKRVIFKTLRTNTLSFLCILRVIIKCAQCRSAKSQSHNQNTRERSGFNSEYIY